jgi:hypothetical protein
MAQRGPSKVAHAFAADATTDDAIDATRLASAINEFNASGADMKTPLVTWGYHHYFHGPLDRAELDKLAGDRPVIVWHRSAHEVFFNTAALKLIELDDEFVKTLPAPAQAQIKLEKGHFFEVGMLSVMRQVSPYMASPEQFRRGLEFSRTSFLKNAITLACEPGMNFTDRAMQDVINSVYSPDETPFNHCFMGIGPEFVFAFDTYWDADYQIHVHNNGDAGMSLCQAWHRAGTCRQHGAAGPCHGQ